MERALLLLLPGLGDALTASPIVRRLRLGGVTTDCVTMLGPVAEYANALGFFDRVIDVPLLSQPLRAAMPLLGLRSRRYDAAVIPFPATRWQYAAVARAVGARTIFAHSYAGLADWLIRTNARSCLVPLRGGHRAAENNRLADAMQLPQAHDLRYEMPANWKSDTIAGLVGIHTGSMMYKGNEARRWPFDRFVEVIHRLLPRHALRVFIGPHEEEDFRRLQAMFGNSIEFVRLGLSQAARALSQCEVFLANDAGLAHVAAGLGVKTIALFGMTDPVRAAPIGRVLALRPSACPPCHDEGMRRFGCALNIDYRCMNRDLPANVVVDAVERMLNSDVPDLHPVDVSQFRLYGRQIIPATANS